MDRKIYENYEKILRCELVPALGCTEPIALAYAGALLRKYLGDVPEKIDVYASGNIIKNVKSVKVPNSGGLKGVECAALLGAVGGDYDGELEVLRTITEEHRQKVREFLAQKICTCHLKKDVPNLYIEAIGYLGSDTVKVVIENTHTNVTRIEKNGKVIFADAESYNEETIDKSSLNLDTIVDFIHEFNLGNLRDLLEREKDYNYAIAREGLKNSYGAKIGSTMIDNNPESIQNTCIAHAAAGSDARMGGCSMPVIITSGSGNQGMTCSIPLIVYCYEKNIEHDKMLRAICLSNLVALDQKRYIGSLSAYCGVVCAAAGVAAGLTYLENGTKEQIKNTVVNTIATVGGMLCDGAKASCAGKIATALRAAFMGHQMAMQNIVYEAGDGLVQQEPERTVKAYGYVAREGMKATDEEIINIMIKQTEIA